MMMMMIFCLLKALAVQHKKTALNPCDLESLGTQDLPRIIQLARAGSELLGYYFYSRFMDAGTGSKSSTQAKDLGF